MRGSLDTSNNKLRLLIRRESPISSWGQFVVAVKTLRGASEHRIQNFSRDKKDKAKEKRANKCFTIMARFRLTGSADCM